MVNDDTRQRNDSGQSNDSDQVHARVHEELDIGEEQVSSNECWDVDDYAELEAPAAHDELEAPIHADLDLGNEQVSSNECYDVEGE